jgi:hypothetical protein
MHFPLIGALRVRTGRPQKEPFLMNLIPIQFWVNTCLAAPRLAVEIVLALAT